VKSFYDIILLIDPNDAQAKAGIAALAKEGIK